MSNLSEYIELIRKEGIPLSEINTGSNEYALSIDISLKAIDLLKKSSIPILGGDIMSYTLGKLAYTYENWYTERTADEDKDGYLNRSYDNAKKYIEQFKLLNDKKRYVVIVI